MFNKVMTGGACQPDGEQMNGMSANPLTNAMNSLIMGDAQGRQAAEGYMNPAEIQQNAAAMQLMQQ